MRKLIFSLVLATAAAVGIGVPAVAEARGSDRIFVGIGDVVFSYGRPYYRHNREPLFVVYERGYPRYFRVPAPVYYAPAPVYYAPPAYGYGYRYAPPPHYRYGHTRYDDHGYRGRGGRRHDDHDRGRGRDHRGGRGRYGD